MKEEPNYYSNASTFDDYSSLLDSMILEFNEYIRQENLVDSNNKIIESIKLTLNYCMRMRDKPQSELTKDNLEVFRFCMENEYSSFYVKMSNLINKISPDKHLYKIIKSSDKKHGDIVCNNIKSGGYKGYFFNTKERNSDETLRRVN